MSILHPKSCFLAVLTVYTLITPSTGSFSSADIVTDAQTLNQIHGGQAGIFPDTSLTLKIRINVTSVTPLLKVNVTFPHTVTTAPNCQSYYDGSLFNCANYTYYHYKLGSLPLAQDVSASFNPVLVGDPKPVVIDSVSLMWSFGNINATGSPNNAEAITITIKVNPRKDSTSWIGSSHDIHVNFLEGNTSVLNLTEPIKILGPAFDISHQYTVISSSDRDIQAGDRVNHSISLTLASRSTADAKNVQVSIGSTNMLCLGIQIREHRTENSYLCAQLEMKNGYFIMKFFLPFTLSINTV